MSTARRGRAAGSPAVTAHSVSCRPATSEEDLTHHFEIRRTVFVAEQKVFEVSDRDRHDDAPGVVHLLARYAGQPAGAVRLFPLDPQSGVWQGDRLSVLAAYRTLGVGAPLVRCAVATAGGLGGSRMLAHVQLANVTFFTRLGWRCEGGTAIYAGLVHQPMSIALAGGQRK